MKRILSTVLLAVMLVLCLAPVSAMAETFNGTVVMSSSSGSLHLRAGAGSDTASVGYVKSGDALKIYTENTGKDSSGYYWTKVKVVSTGKTGYLKNIYLGITGATSTKAKVYVSASGGTLYVRKGPSTSYDAAGVVKHGTAITVLKKGSTWSLIKISGSGLMGYIKNAYINTSSSSSSSSSTSTSSGSGNLKSGKYTAGTVTGSSVNLRKGPGTGYAVITSLAKGTKLMILGSSGNWYKVSTMGGKTGYMSKTYVASYFTAKTTANLNLRSGPGTGYSKLGTYAKGSSITVYSVNGNWAYVKAGSKKGYMSVSYLKY